MHKILKISFSSCLSFFLAFSMSAYAVSDEDGVSQRLKEKFPGLANTSVTKVKEQGVNGLYYVVVNGQVAYVDEHVTFILTRGNLLSANTAENLTLVHQQDANKQLFSDLPRRDAIKTVYGNGERELITIEDPDCPACQSFTKNLHFYSEPNELNVTVYTFPYALKRLHPDASRKASLIWCSASSPEGRSNAWKNWMLNRVLPDNRVENCDSPVDTNIERFSQLGINSTPTVLFPDGSALPGGILPKELIESLDIIYKGYNN